VSPRPDVAEVSDRALVLYALVRRGYVEHVIADSGGDPTRIAQGQAAVDETDHWLRRESLDDAPTELESRLLSAESGSWPRAAIDDALWRKESLGILLWALHHIESLPGYEREFEQPDLDSAITRYGSVSSFRAEGRLRPDAEIESAWLEADAWFGAAEGRDGEDATLASISAERFRALSWLRDADAPPA
jgi:Domain of unknown function (DUF4272)